MPCTKRGFGKPGPGAGSHTMRGIRTMQHPAPTGPLSGLKILEIGHYIAAPFATRVLADLGADVIKIEPPSGDPVRKWGAVVGDDSLWWSVHGRNKRSVTLNLKAPEARDVLRRIVSGCDALIENFRPGQLARYGLGDDELRAINPGLVIGHISGFGQNGPYRDKAAFGVIGEAIGGLRYLSNHPAGTTDLPPVRVGVSIGDSLAGLYAALGVISAIWQRDAAGGQDKARTVDVALSEAVLSMMEGMLPEYGHLGKIKQPTGSRIATAAPSSAYPTSDGGWILIAANSEPLFQRLCGLMGRPELPQDPRFVDNPTRVANAEALDEIIRQWTSGLEARTLLGLLQEADVPSSKVYTAEDCATDPQFLVRGMVRRVHDETLGFDVTHPGIVPHIAEDPGTVRWSGPRIGQHTDEILTEMGFSEAEITHYRQKEVI
ncbi:CaiB/BaiF CoA transferase family protein [Pseudochelatococcus sp. B33]